ncbi:cytochrome P450 4c21-like [Thrips palmi]|uniref:Cytochrome P450 4c21-like n=1 Tax=Thrips palmi TaxID=161013 RepID=A0A6P8Z6P6_THRPL|nr:cytochrome P450 4c21-like [Thrips palmi]XP_034245656.1 cytochrome P450 4c21-like [Thrips palmi]
MSATPDGRGMSVVGLCCAAVAALLAVSWAWPWLRRYARFRQMEMAIPGPLSLPLLGSVHVFFFGDRKKTLLQRILAYLEECRGELSRISIGNKLFVFVTDADHLGAVLRDRQFVDKPWFAYSFIKGLLGDGIFTANGATWQRDRATVTPTFHLEVLEGYFDAFHEEAQGLARRIAPMVGRDAKVAHEVFTATCLAAIRTTLASSLDGHDLQELDDLIRGIEPYMTNVKRRCYNPLLWPDAVFNWSSLGRKQRQHEDQWNKLMGRIISRKATEIQSKKEQYDLQSAKKLGYKEFKCVLDIVLEGTISGEMDLTEDEILTATKTMFGTAIDSPVIVLGFVFKILSIRPDVQERVYAEINEITQGSDRPLTIDDLPRMEYLERVVKETLRMFPVGPLIARQCQEDCEVAGKRIPAGTVLVLNVIGAHRDPRHHPDPLHFDPDRFLPERAKDMHPFSFVPFSGGPRNCVGQQYAMMLLKTLTAVILRAYRILPASDGITQPSQFPITFDIMLRYVNGVKVRFEHREGHHKDAHRH